MSTLFSAAHRPRQSSAGCILASHSSRVSSFTTKARSSANKKLETRVGPQQACQLLNRWCKWAKEGGIWRFLVVLHSWIVGTRAIPVHMRISVGEQGLHPVVEAGWNAKFSHFRQQFHLPDFVICPREVNIHYQGSFSILKAIIYCLSESAYLFHYWSAFAETCLTRVKLVVTL